MDIYNWIIANKVVLGGGGILALLAGPKGLELAKMLLAKIKALASKVGKPAVVSTVSTVTTKSNEIDFELVDQEAIRHLRNRAAELKNTQLVALLKQVDGIFYDVHTGISVADVPDATKE